MNKKQIQIVLSEIFDPYISGEQATLEKIKKAPSYNEVEEFAGLIAADGTEESFQKFLNKKPHFLFRLASSMDQTIIGFLVKPPISPLNIADYAILSAGQGGCSVSLIEIERPGDTLFTQRLTPAKKLQAAMGQIDDWNAWIEQNKSTFLNTTFEILAKAPRYSDKVVSQGSFIGEGIEQAKRVWEAFGGNSQVNLDYTIVIGRWSKLTVKQRQRLIYMNQRNEHMNIRTFDNFVRKAIEGPKYLW